MLSQNNGNKPSAEYGSPIVRAKESYGHLTPKPCKLPVTNQRPVIIPESKGRMAARTQQLLAIYFNDDIVLQPKNFCNQM